MTQARSGLKVLFDWVFYGSVASFIVVAFVLLKNDLLAIDGLRAPYLFGGAALYWVEWAVATMFLIGFLFLLIRYRERLTRLKFILAVAAAVTLIGASAFTFKGSAYLAATNSDAIEGYVDFLDRYPSSRFSPDVNRRLDSLLDPAIDLALARQNVEDLRALDAISPFHPRSGVIRNGIVEIAWEIADSVNTEEGFHSFSVSYPDAARATEARERRNSLALSQAIVVDTEENYREVLERYPNHADSTELVERMGSAAWITTESANTLNSYTEFADEYQSHPNAVVAKDRLEIESMTLAAAVAAGLVEAIVTGNGLSSVSVRVTRKRPGRLLSLTTEPGTYFAASGGGYQNMIATGLATFDLINSRTATRRIPASCANFRRSTPGLKNLFSVRPAAPGSELRRLMATIAEAGATEVVSQVAVWVITDDISPSTLRSGYVRGNVPAASASDIDRAEALLEQAGISTADKRLFR